MPNRAWTVQECGAAVSIGRMNEQQSLDHANPAYLEQLAVDVVTRATTRGADAAEVSLSAGEGLSIKVRDGACETVEHERDKSLAVTVYLGGRKGSATTSDYSLAALNETVDAAYRIAEYAEPDPYAGLAEPEYLATLVPELDLDHPWALSAEDAIELALVCDRVALGSDPRLKQSDGSSVSRYRGTRAYANSHGFHAAYRGTRHGLSCVMIASDELGMQRGYWYTSARDPVALEDAESVGRLAAERTLAKLGAHKIPTTTLPVLFESRVAGSLFGHLVGAISGSAQYRRASFLQDALDSEVMSVHISLAEQPHLPRALGSAPFDGDGVATSAKAVVTAGRLNTYLLGAYSARRLGRQPTGNAGGVHNLVASNSGRSFETIVASLDRALIVTDMMGMGVNGVTGDYSRGASGFLVERGEIVAPVEEITVAGNLKSMLKDIVEIGSDVETRGTIHTGSILIGSMAIAGS